MNDVTGSGDVYTMAEAARLKGVSYHTVSRAVRRGKLPATRLGRMALITSEDLREWRPMRERAPRKYRRREPNPEATPALLDLASAERVELASRLAAMYEAMHAATDGSPRDELYDLIVDRLAGALNLRRVSIRLADQEGRKSIRVASYGPPNASRVADAALDEAALSADSIRPARALVQATGGSTTLVAPMVINGDVIGVIVGDKNGEAFELNSGELDLVQAMANLAGLAAASSRTLLAAGVA